ncbi:MAG: UpxY family transcription antiterminator [Acidobacteriia bacterium]|nr:UpxY family transcription antiterminator [Terriglobia bacterium]
MDAVSKFKAGNDGEDQLSSSFASRWFALHVRTRFESAVAVHLQGKGYEFFLPMYVEKRRWSDRMQEIEQPLFPGYVFCRFDPQARLPILVTPGVIGVVGVGKTPIAIADEEIAGIQTVVNSGLPSQPWPFLQIGERVQIGSGPLHGLTGILEEIKGRHRLILAVTLLQRSVAVEIDVACVRPVLEGRNALLGAPAALAV